MHRKDFQKQEEGALRLIQDTRAAYPLIGSWASAARRK